MNVDVDHGKLRPGQRVLLDLQHRAGPKLIERQVAAVAAVERLRHGGSALAGVTSDSAPGSADEFPGHRLADDPRIGCRPARRQRRNTGMLRPAESTWHAPGLREVRFAW